MKKEFSKNTTEVFTKTIFHYIPKIQKYIDEIKDPRKRKDYTMRYLIISEMLMFMSEGKSQRFTETAYKDTKYLENIEKIINEEVKKIPDAEIYTNVFWVGRDLIRLCLFRYRKCLLCKKVLYSVCGGLTSSWKQQCQIQGKFLLFPTFLQSLPETDY